MADIIKDLRSAVASASQEALTILQKDFREDLNKLAHILDLSYSTLMSSTYNRLKSSLSDKEKTAFDLAYDRLLKVLLKVYNKTIVKSIQSPEFPVLYESMTKKGSKLGPILVYNGNKEGVFLVGTTFESLQRHYSINVARDPTLKSTRFGTTTSYVPDPRAGPGEYISKERIRTDFGHLPAKDDINLVSPLTQKFTALVNSGVSSLIRANAEKALEELYAVQAKLTHRFKNTTPEAIAESRKIMAKGYVVITLQSESINKKFSTRESEIYFKLLRSIAEGVDYTSISGSNTVLEDIVQGIVLKISGSKTKLKKHKEQSTNLNVKIKAKSKVGVSKSNLINAAQNKYIPPTNNLLAILSASINEQVRKNMGTGNDKKILNLRSGRLADSVSIERLSESRAGMVSVFYNYMRNPYATFSDGGRQQNPKTRDPKLLISKSIREIGAAMIGNRMRAVLV
jgi:hypothetical protein